MVNRVIGAGIFGVPAVLFADVGPMSIAAMILAAIVVLGIALCFAEVGSRYSGSGGPYLYALDAFGPAAGFVVGWLLWITQLGGFAAVANLLVNYLAWFEPAVTAGVPRAAIITALVVVLVIINIRGVRQAARLNNLLTVGKLVPLVLFIVIGAFYVDRSAFAMSSPASLGAVIAVVLVAVYPYSGFEVTVALSGEMREPARTIPAGLLTGMLLVTAVYVGVQVVAIGTLPGLATSTRPLADAGEELFGRPGALVMIGGAVVSTLGVLHAILLAAGRVPFAMAEQHQLPAAVGRIHPLHRTPAVGLVISGVGMLAFTLATTFVSALTVTVGLRVLIYLVTCAALPVLRRRPASATAFIVPAGSLLAITCVGICVALLAVRPWTETRQLAVAVLLGLAGWGVSALWRRRKSIGA